MSEPHQPKMHYEDFNDALHDIVQVLGGYKKVGPKLWPEAAADEAAHKLRHCLNKERREKLSPDQVLLLLRWAREANFHGAKHFLDIDTGYQPSMPADPGDQVARLQREFMASVDRQQRILEEMKRLTKSPLAAAA